MAQLCDFVARYHRLLEGDAYRDLAWAEELQQRMRELGLTESGRLVSPILRPHFISRRQLTSLCCAAERFSSVLNQLESILLEKPALLNRMQLLPAEKMLAAIPWRHAGLSVTSQIDSHIQNGSLRFRGFQASTPAGVAYSEPLAGLFLDLEIVKEFQRGHCKLSTINAGKSLREATLKVWSEFGGKKTPKMAVLEYRPKLGSDSNEGRLLAGLLGQRGSEVPVISPDQLEYRDGKLRAGDLEVDLVFRRVKTQELLVRSDLSHPLLRAYRDGAVCMINSFRSGIAQRLSLFDLLTDDRVTGCLSAADRKLIRAFVPWTRVLADVKTQYAEQTIDLISFVQLHREQLVLRPDEESPEHRTYVGAEMSNAGWERALRSAVRTPYVVQERIACDTQMFPLFRYGELQMKEAEVSVYPHIFNGKVDGASAVLQSCSEGFTASMAIAPVFVVDPC